MASFGAVIPARNDDYGGNLVLRASYCLNSMISELDEIIYVDWNSEGEKDLIEEIGDGIIKSPKFKWIRITPEQAKEWTFNDPEAQLVCEVMARNIGLRRLKSDYLVSTNIDVICPPRIKLEKSIIDVKDDQIFWTTGMRPISLWDITPLGSPLEPKKIMDALVEKEGAYPQQPLVSILPGDQWSLISNCGDFQVAHRDIWYKIRGFEERLYKRSCADTNIQRKASIFGYKLGIALLLPVWHMGHEGGFGGGGGLNDAHLAVFMEETTNPETWGHSDIKLKLRSLK
jgi:hypothetical protein